jgi:hypothetical protein
MSITMWAMAMCMGLIEYPVKYEICTDLITRELCPNHTDIIYCSGNIEKYFEGEMKTRINNLRFLTDGVMKPKSLP